MKAFHLGAFEVMVVTDNRLSESGSLYQCVGGFQRSLQHTEHLLIEPALWTQTLQGQWRVTKTAMGVGSLMLFSPQMEKKSTHLINSCN